jgi:hypothetical protein
MHRATTPCSDCNPIVCGGEPAWSAWGYASEVPKGPPAEPAPPRLGCFLGCNPVPWAVPAGRVCAQGTGGEQSSGMPPSDRDKPQRVPSYPSDSSREGPGRCACIPTQRQLPERRGPEYSPAPTSQQGLARYLLCEKKPRYFQLSSWPCMQACSRKGWSRTSFL